MNKDAEKLLHLIEHLDPEGREGALCMLEAWSRDDDTESVAPYLNSLGILITTRGASPAALMTMAATLLTLVKESTLLAPAPVNLPCLFLGIAAHALGSEVQANFKPQADNFDLGEFLADAIGEEGDDVDA